MKLVFSGPLWSSRARLSSVALCALLALLCLAGCSTGSATATPTPTPLVGGCVAPGPNPAPPSNPRLWARDIITVGLVSTVSSGSPFSLPGDITDVQTYIHNILSHRGLDVRQYEPQDGIPVLTPFDSSKTAVAFFQLQKQPSGLDCLGEAIDAINASDLNIAVNSHVYIAGASPDWLTIGGGLSDGVGGSPDGAPQAPTDKNTTLPLPPTSGTAGSDALVIVLDTADPAPGGLSQWPATGNPFPLAPLPSSPTSQCSNSSCALLTDLSSQAFEADMKLTDENAYIARYTGYGSTPPPNPPTTPPNTREHGLFVSEIIHHLAPGAKIRLIRVLNDYGAGDIRTLIAALQAIPSIVSAEKVSSETHVVVNLSLGVAPTVGCLLLDWQAAYPLPSTSGAVVPTGCDLNDPLAPGPTLQALQAGQNTPAYRVRLYASLGLAVESLANTKNYTVVAAAGNDGRLDAKMPAAFCGVKDVAASSVTGPNAIAAPDPFSNYPWVGSQNCLSVQQSPPPGANQTIAVTIGPTGVPVSVKGINGQALVQVQLSHMNLSDALATIGMGICSLHPGFTSGIADWQGTSFATAFISGNIAANSGRVPSSLSQSMPCTP